MISAHQLVPVMGVTFGLAFGSAAAAGNAVSDWHTNMESAVVVTGKKSPTVAFVYFAYADIAMFDACGGSPTSQVTGLALEPCLIG